VNERPKELPEDPGEAGVPLLQPRGAVPRLRALLALTLLLAASAADAATPRPHRVRRPGEHRAGKRTAPPPAEAPAAAQGRAPLELQYRPGPLTAANDGKTVRIAIRPGNLASLGGQAYELLNVHFHAPPHDRGGRADGLAVHLVHLGGEERPLVLVVLVEPGPANTTLGRLLPRLPTEDGESRAYENAAVSPKEFLPLGLAYSEVEGEDDPDGCTPGGARRLVLRTHLTASRAQLDAFRRLLAPAARPQRARSARGAPR